jgi:hypothetical protein
MCRQRIANRHRLIPGSVGTRRGVLRLCSPLCVSYEEEDTCVCHMRRRIHVSRGTPSLFTALWAHEQEYSERERARARAREINTHTHSHTHTHTHTHKDGAPRGFRTCGTHTKETYGRERDLLQCQKRPMREGGYKGMWYPHKTPPSLCLHTISLSRRCTYVGAIILLPYQYKRDLL